MHAWIPVIFISGAYRGENAWAVEQNIRAAEDMMVRVLKAGMMGVCTHTMLRHMHGVVSDEHFINATRELMRRCDAVVLVSNWHHSDGARGEALYAAEIGLPVFGAGLTPGETMEQLVAWSRPKPLTRVAPATP